MPPAFPFCYKGCKTNLLIKHKTTTSLCGWLRQSSLPKDWAQFLLSPEPVIILISPLRALPISIPWDGVSDEALLHSPPPKSREYTEGSLCFHGICVLCVVCFSGICVICVSMRHQRKHSGYVKEADFGLGLLASLRKWLLWNEIQSLLIGTGSRSQKPFSQEFI